MLTPEFVSHCRSQFPALNPEHSPAPIFFDNPGGTQVVESVIEAVSDYYRSRCANTGGAFETSRRTDETICGARQAMADLLGAPDPDTIAFGPSMTALTFHLARSFAYECEPGDEVIVTELDHDANVTPWRDLARVGVKIRTIPFHAEDGTLDSEAFSVALERGKTRLVALGHASNALGTVTDLKPLIALAHEAGAAVFVDAVQSVPHVPVDVVDIDCDFLACSSYKFFGPHAGILYGKRSCLENLRPHKVRPAKNAIPYAWEQGTLNHEGLAGITAAVDYLDTVSSISNSPSNSPSNSEVGSSSNRRESLIRSMTAIRDYERTLSTQLLEGLARVSDVKIWGLSDPARASERVPTVAFTRTRETPRAVCERLGTAGICAWNGNYYALGVMERLGLEASGGAVRVGLTHYNTPEEVDRFLEVLSMRSSRIG
jgi:cysteine desulfurase family protein (TIGR01976 family)